ncbi:hypothetical protein [uncultured Oscillibacter sp.]|uniref:hypothetical protein n=1 Tax=uncultured Oscillibacter sp. TaxID=876091 RepID=UPI00262E7A63|nr:hypothetical protein [uncultured Oscillibacter sp.]
MRFENEQTLQDALRRKYPDAVCLGAVSYIPLKGSGLARVEPASNGYGHSGVRIRIINCRAGPVDSVTLRFWELPSRTKQDSPNEMAWDVYRPTPDIDALLEKLETYLQLFRGRI